MPNGVLVGANYSIYDGEGEEDTVLYTIPSFQGLWQLDEPNITVAIITISDATECISVFCSNGKLKQLPNDILVMRFDLDVVNANPAQTTDWKDGIKLNVERHGNYYRIYGPVPNSVYVARTVWNEGVLEHGWIIVVPLSHKAYNIY